MKKFLAGVLIASGVFLVYSWSVRAETSLFSDGFETGNLNNWPDNPANIWHVSNCSGESRSGAHHACANGTGAPQSDAIWKRFSVAGLDAIEVRYWYRIDKSLAPQEKFRVQWCNSTYYSESVCSWNTVVTHDGAASGGWTYDTVTIPVPANVTQMSIRFYIYFERDISLVGVSLDDVSMVGIEKLDPVIIIPGILGSWQKNGAWVIDPVLHTYDNLINNFANNGYTPGVDLFTFPYEWRNSNIQTAQLLKQKIAQVKAICHCAKVDLVAHSMGGLVARQYIQSDDYQNDVDQLIFLGTPHEGAPKDYLAWEGAEFGTEKIDALLEFLLSLEAKKNLYWNTLNYIHDRPIASVEELLPIYDYLRDDVTGNLRSYFTNYPRNTFLELLKSRSQKLFDSGVRMVNIVGDTGPTSTIEELRVVDSPKAGLWEHGYPKDYDSAPEHGLISGVGDGTVPLRSATAISVTDTRVTNFWHRDLVTQAEDQVIGALTSRRPLVLFDKSWTGNMLFTKILSPADIQIIAPDGKRIGKDFATWQEINEIEDAFYSGFFTDDEYIAIPNPLDGEYKVITQGTGTGEYTVATALITETTLADEDFTANTVPGAVSELNVVVNNAQPEQIQVQPTDTTPPSIAITSPELPTYPRSAVLLLSADVSDPSGVAIVRYFFDGMPASPSVDLFFSKLGIHTVAIQATDTVNNIASESVSFTIIATFDSSISDTNRAYIFGWIKTSRIRDAIINKFSQARDNARKRASALASLSTYLDGQLKKKTINQQAYDLLKEDVAWLQTH